MTMNEELDESTPPADAPISRPRSIDIAVYATVVRALAWLASAFAIDPNRNALIELSKKAIAKSKNPNQKLEVITTHDALKLAIPLAVILLVLAKFLRDGKSWAKWLIIITGLPLVATADVLKWLNAFGPLPVTLKVAYVVVGLATVASYWFMLRPDATAYIKSVSPPMTLFRAPAVAGADDAGDTDISNALTNKERSKPRAKPKSRKSPEEQ